MIGQARRTGRPNRFLVARPVPRCQGVDIAEGYHEGYHQYRDQEHWGIIPAHDEQGLGVQGRRRRSTGLSASSPNPPS